MANRYRCSPLGGHGGVQASSPFEFSPCAAPLGTPPAAISVVDGAILNSVQCTNVPPGASGSSTTSTSSRAPPGTPDQASGGESPLPSQVYCRGIAAPSANAELVSSIAAPLTAGAAEPRSPPPHPA